MNMFYERRFAAIEERIAELQRQNTEQAQLLAEVRSLATLNSSQILPAVQPKPTRKKP